MRRSGLCLLLAARFASAHGRPPPDQGREDAGTARAEVKAGPLLPPPPPSPFSEGRPRGRIGPPPPPPEPFENARAPGPPGPPKPPEPRKPPEDHVPPGVVTFNHSGAVWQGMQVVEEHMKAGRISSAVEELERIRSAVHEDPSQVRLLAEAEGMLASGLLRGESQEEARRIARIGVETDPEAARPREALGLIAYARNDLEDAVGEWNRGLSSNPKDPGLRRLVAKTQVELASLKQYRTRSSDHFVLTFDGEEDREIADLTLAGLEEAYRKVPALYAFNPADRVPVVIYPNEAFDRLEGKVSWAAGMFDGKVRAGSSGAAGHPSTFRTILTHEYGHAILHRAVRGAQVPGWFDEGLAQVAEGFVEPQVELTCGFGHQMPLADLRGPFGQLTGNDRHIWDCYSTARHAVERLIARRGREAVQEVLRRTGKGEPFDQAFERSIGQSYASFVEAFDKKEPQY